MIEKVKTGNESLWSNLGLLYFVTTGVNFINIFSTAFTHADPKAQIDTDDLTEFLHFWDLCV